MQAGYIYRVAAGGAVLAALIVVISACSSNDIAQSTKPDSQPTKEQYAAYKDPHFGYSLTVPGDFTASASSPGTTPMGWISSDESVNIEVYAEVDSAQSQTVDMQLAQCKQQVTSAGGAIDFAQQTANAYTCSGQDSSHNVYYEHGFIGSHGQYILIASYPAADKSRWDSIVQHVSASFKPGSL